MENISLCGLHLLKVMKKVDKQFHAVNTTRHSVKDAHSDISKMATYILDSGASTSTNVTAATQAGSSGTCTTTVSNEMESFVDPLIKGMQKIRSGWLRDFLTRDDMESEIESEDGDILTTDEINFELHN